MNVCMDGSISIYIMNEQKGKNIGNISESRKYLCYYLVMLTQCSGKYEDGTNGVIYSSKRLLVMIGLYGTRDH